MLKIISIVYLLILCFTIIFQVGLILGKKWGEYTMGGYHKGKLPIHLRFFTFISVLILIFISLIILQESKLIDNYFKLQDNLIWGVIVFNIISFFMNTITRSKKERMLWQPLTGIMLIISIIIVFIR